jgi:hypothetical protein
MNIPPDVIEKFWKSVEKTNYCWNWKGLIDIKGRPCIKYKSKDYKPRRISLIIANKKLADNENVHTLICQNKLCVNPDHLVFGTEARFWSKVQKLNEANESCWVWTGNHSNKMYGKFSYRKDNKIIYIRAHVYSWELANNFTLKKKIGHFVCHKCDHPWCVNPDHLFLGNAKENAEDKVMKGRVARGEKIGNSKLTEIKIKEIRSLHNNGSNTKELANLFDVKILTIQRIVKRRSWKHII